MKTNLRRFALAAVLGLALVGLSATAAQAQIVYSQPLVVTRVATPNVSVGVTYGVPTYAPSYAYAPVYVSRFPRLMRPVTTVYATPYTTYYPSPTVYASSPVIYTRPAFYP